MVVRELKLELVTRARYDYNNDEDERTSERSRQAGDARVRRVEARLGVSVRVESLNGFVVDASAARARGVFAADGVDPRALRSKLSSLWVKDGTDVRRPEPFAPNFGVKDSAFLLKKCLSVAPRSTASLPSSFGTSDTLMEPPSSRDDAPRAPVFLDPPCDASAAPGVAERSQFMTCCASAVPCDGSPAPFGKRTNALALLRAPPCDCDMPCGMIIS